MPSLRGCSALLLALGLAACTRGESPADETTVADATAATTEVATTGLDCAAAPSDLFTRRIAPLLASDRP